MRRDDRSPTAARPSPLLVALMALAVALAGCGGPRGVSLTELAINAPEYDGQEVEVSGVVREFGDDEGPVEHHYVLQDADVNRVQLLPDEEAAPHVGSAVRVIGTFSYADDRGRALQIDTIEAVTAP